MKICLDAGHYGKYNRSKVVPEYYESEMNWNLVWLLSKELESYGFEVVMTRADQSKDLDLVSRGKKAKGCNLFLSIHSNACDVESVDYPLVVTMLDGKGDKLGKALAEKIQELMGTVQNGKIIHKEGGGGVEWYGVLRGAAQVGTMGMIIEHSFHTNTKAAKWLSEGSNLKKMAEAEVKLIAEHFGLAKKSESVETKPADSKPTTSATEKLPLLKKGDKGDPVKAMQILLIGYGFSCGSAGADGDFGNGTESALKKYQSKKSLSVDACCGPNTWSKLLGL